MPGSGSSGDLRAEEPRRQASDRASGSGFVEACGQGGVRGGAKPQFPQLENAGNKCTRITGVATRRPRALKKQAPPPSSSQRKGEGESISENGGGGAPRPAALTKLRAGLRGLRDLKTRAELLSFPGP